MTHSQTQGAEGAGTKTAGETVMILYENWRGETAVRRITPIAREWFGSSDWHPEPQWLFTAFDMEKEAFRDFARAGVKAWGQAAVAAVLASAPAATPGVPDSVRALSEAAFPGPWRDEDEQISGSAAHIEAPWNGGDIICDMPSEGEDSRCHWPANRAFIVAAVNFVRALIAAQPAGQAGDAGAANQRDMALEALHTLGVRLGVLDPSVACDGPQLLTAMGAYTDSLPAPNSTRTGAAETEEDARLGSPSAPRRGGDGVEAACEVIRRRFAVSKNDALALTEEIADVLDALNPGSGEMPAEPTEKMLIAMSDAAAHAEFEMNPARRKWVRRIYRAALAARPEAPSDAGWRPIDQAKRDGTVYLLGFYDGPEKTDEHWCAIEGWYETGINDRCWYDVFNERVEPAYFRERIAPPSEPAPSGQAEG